jgi:hypothetical protein
LNWNGQRSAGKGTVRKFAEGKEMGV